MSTLTKAIARLARLGRSPTAAPRGTAGSAAASDMIREQSIREQSVRGQTICFAVGDETAKYEPQVLDYIDRLERGAVFYDLGACVGYFSLYAAARGLDVCAFEVEAKNFAALSANLEANPELQVRAFSIGVSDGSSDWADLRVGQDKAGGHHKTLCVDEFAGPANIVSDEYAVERVRVGALDRLVSELRLRPPQHMKIDIDGSEVVFLRGARSVLASRELRSLMFELYEDSPYFGPIVSELAAHGFSLTTRHPICQPWPGCERLFNCEFWK
jgi:FkbM family methyltransferase